MRNKKHKKLQKRVTKIVNALNKNVKEDSLWQGRFYCHQVDGSYYHEYEDGSGGSFYFCLEYVDTKTNHTEKHYFSTFGGSRFLESDLWRKLNDFVCEQTMKEKGI